ncbi:17533_t:CDS:2 [Gigaspora margarita]|uniref:17533_t:CDS:1 n=1 Tax=Gigaspora margarita TaxID=4874 RepID=A0ABN7UUQ0_GIGMA|nr:17533_t:CDS:2 [Gigaspora margarita]
MTVVKDVKIKADNITNGIIDPFHLKIFNKLEVQNPFDYDYNHFDLDYFARIMKYMNDGNGNVSIGFNKFKFNIINKCTLH